MPWYALYTKPKQELKTAEKLIAIGIEAYCPSKTEVRQWSDRKKKVTVPLLTSYVFVQIEEKERHLVFDIPSVVQYVFWLKKPAVISDQEMQLLKESIEKPYKELQIREIQKGDLIEIHEGPFKGQTAEVISKSNRKTKVVLKEIGMTLVISEV